MRTHKQIADSRRSEEIAIALGRHGMPTKVKTCRKWVERDSIPAEYWRALVAAKLATYSELATYAEHKFKERSGIPPAE